MSESSAAVAGAVAERFEELYGSAPDGVWAAPGRVNLIGEHTDYNDGFVMPFALPHTVVAAVSRRDDGVLRLHSADIDAPVAELTLDDLAPGSDKRWTAYPAGVVWRCARPDTRSPARTSTWRPPSRRAPTCPRRPPWRS